MNGFIKWLLTDGQALAEANGYSKLPTALQEKAIAKLASVTAA